MQEKHRMLKARLTLFINSKSQPKKLKKLNIGYYYASTQKSFLTPPNFYPNWNP
jgi:hypothetical protein